MLSPSEIQESMEQVLNDLDQCVDDIRVAGNELADKERAFKVSYARARMKARATTGPTGRPMAEKDADDVATVETGDARFDYTIAQQTMTYCREAKSAAEHRLDGLRTMSASVRAAGG